MLFIKGDKTKTDMGETRTLAGNETSLQNCSRISDEKEEFAGTKRMYDGNTVKSGNNVT